MRPATLKRIRAILLLPFMATVIVPAVVLVLTHRSLGWDLVAPWGLVLRGLGLLLFGTGLLLLLQTNLLFTRIGNGTLAPWDPTQRLVVRGVYRHLRNPMISGVFCILLGEALVFGSMVLLIWFGLFLAANGIYIPLVEEPALKARFGAQYLDYRKHVPRWIPRLRPWRGEE